MKFESSKSFIEKIEQSFFEVVSKEEGSEIHFSGSWSLWPHLVLLIIMSCAAILINVEVIFIMLMLVGGQAFLKYHIVKQLAKGIIENVK